MAVKYHIKLVMANTLFIVAVLTTLAYFLSAQIFLMMTDVRDVQTEISGMSIILVA